MASPPPSAPDPSGTPCPHCGEPHPPTYTHCPNTGKALTAGPALVGRVIAGRYRIIGLLGEGGMGAVYVAEHTLIGRKVAIKRLHPQLAGDEKAVQRFQREARAAASTGHEHIVEILDLGFAEDGAPYLVMEYLRGQSLAALLRKEHRLDPRRACDVVGQVLAGLDAVHRQHIVHRDLKPDNVFLTRRGGAPADWVKILDFGISKMRRDDGETFDLTRTGVMMGTPFYMSPEQARGMKSLDHRVDLYAVGVILYECITGRVPFEGENYHQLLQSILRVEPPRPTALRPELDPALEAVMLRAIAKDPRTRFDSAEAMLAALLPFGAQLPAGGGVMESGEGPAVAAPTMLLATTPVSPGGHADRLAVMRDGYEDGGSLTDARTAPRSSGVPRAPAELARPTTGRGTPPSPARTSAATPAVTPSSGAGARYFFAASDDWDEVRARAAIEGPGRVTPLGREPSSSFAREPSAPFAREPISGLVSTGASREPPRTPDAPQPYLRPAPDRLSREGPRLLAPVEPEPGGREPSGSFSTSPQSVSGSPQSFSGSPQSFSGSPQSFSGSPPSFAGASPSFSGASPSFSGASPSFPSSSQGSGALPPADPWSLTTPARSSNPGTDAEVKGSLVIATLDHLSGVHGASAVSQIRSLLDGDADARLSGVILPMAWLPIAILDQLVRGAERVLGGGEGATATAIGRAIADRELPTTHRLFMQTASPSAASERIPQLFRLYHSRGEAKVLPTPGGGVRVEIELGPPESLSYAWVLAGFWQRMLELTGAREVRAAVVSCRGRGDDRTAIALRWR